MDIKTGITTLDNLLSTDSSMIIKADESISLPKIFADNINRVMTVKSEPIKVAYFDVWNDIEFFIKRYTLEDMCTDFRNTPRNKAILYFTIFGLSEIVEWYNNVLRDEENLRYIIFSDMPLMKEFSCMFPQDYDLTGIKELLKEAKSKGVSCIALCNEEYEDEEFDSMFDLTLEMINNDGLDVRVVE